MSVNEVGRSRRRDRQIWWTLAIYRMLTALNTGSLSGFFVVMFNALPSRKGIDIEAARRAGLAAYLYDGSRPFDFFLRAIEDEGRA